MYCWRRVEDAKGTRSMAAMGPQQSDLKVELMGSKSLDFFWTPFFLPSSYHIFSFSPSRSTELSREFSLEHLRHRAAPRFFADALPGLPCAGQRGHAVTREHVET